METIAIGLFALVLFIDAIFEKWLIWHKLETFGESQKIGFWVYKLTHCRFCLLFWLTVLNWTWFASSGVIQWTTFPVVFVVSGLTTLKHRL